MHKLKSTELSLNKSWSLQRWDSQSDVSLSSTQSKTNLSNGGIFSFSMNFCRNWDTDHWLILKANSKTKFFQFTGQWDKGTTKINRRLPKDGLIFYLIKMFACLLLSEKFHSCTEENVICLDCSVCRGLRDCHSIILRSIENVSSLSHRTKEKSLFKPM